jgi:hypothetical protein
VTTFEPISWVVLLDRLARHLVDTPGSTAKVTRVAIDGAPALEPDGLAADLAAALTALGRPVGHVRAATFWRDASVRLEYGHHDIDAYLSWLDAAALRREVLDPAAASGSYLPSLRDPRTNRATRSEPVQLPPGGFVIVSGSLLSGHGLPFELTVHLSASTAALARRTPTDQAWTLPAYARYDAEAHPRDSADVVVRMEDPRRPAVRGLQIVRESN